MNERRRTDDDRRAARLIPQVRGLDLDARTDIFSLGVVLYELLAVQQPFSGASSLELMTAIVDREPRPLARFQRSMPEDLERIVMKALRRIATRVTRP